MPKVNFAATCVDHSPRGMIISDVKPTSNGERRW